MLHRNRIPPQACGCELAQVLERAPLPIREQVIPHSLLGEIQEAFLTNSNVGMVPVAQIDGHALPIGSDTVNLIRWLEPRPAPGTQYRFLERRGIRR